MMSLLVSFPRSGNTWLRYIVETISGRPTIGDNNPKDVPIYQKVNTINIVSKEPILYKRHEFKRQDSGSVIVLVRDYREAIVRHKSEIFKIDISCRQEFAHFPKQHREKIQDLVDWYMRILERFDSWVGPKLLLYYEDIITNPTDAITKLVNFLGLDHRKVPTFMASYEKHKKASIKYYNDCLAGSETSGNAIVHHAKRIPKDMLNLLVSMVHRHTLCHKYLIRYD